MGAQKAIDLQSKYIVIVCQKSKIKDWVEHFKKNYQGCIVDDLTNKNEFIHFVTYAGFNDKLFTFIGVINYELAFRRKELLEIKNFTLMLDESSMISNPTAKRTKFILKMQPDNVILLSGTPSGGKYEKLWSQLKLLGWNISKKLFYQQFVIQEWIEDESGFKIPVIKGYKNVERLKRKLKEHGCVFMKTDEVMTLPNMIDIPIEVYATSDYRYFMKNNYVLIDNSIELIGNTTLTKRLCARQLCGMYNYDKLNAFNDLITSTEDRLIVFYNFNQELDLLKAIADRYDKPISYVNGSVKDLEAYGTEKNSITFVQYQAGAMGLNLQKANKITYFTLPQSSDLFEQSKKRIHRIGQNNPCFYYYMICRNSVEEQILETLKMRKDYDDRLFEQYERSYK